MRRRQMYGTHDFKSGDMLLFLYHGLFIKGIIINKQEAHNYILQVKLYYIDETGCVSETESIYDMDQITITRYAYRDLDSVIRKRILYSAEQMKGKRLFRGFGQKSLQFVLGCMSGNLAYTQ